MLGISQIITQPSILKILSPHYAVLFMWANPGCFLIPAKTSPCNFSKPQNLNASAFTAGFVVVLVTLFCVTDLSAIAVAVAICMGHEAHEDSRKRYTAAVPYTAIYMVIGSSGAAITGLLAAFSKELVVTLAGLALPGTIGNGLATALKDEMHREAALITVLVTLSGVVIAGIGSALWSVEAGAVALFVQQYGQTKAGNPTENPKS